MAIPEDRLSTTVVRGNFLPPDDRRSELPLIDWELGGVALNDPSQGHQVKIWTADTDGEIIRIYPEPPMGSIPLDPVTVITEPVNEIVEISFTFDQNMRPTIAYVILVGIEPFQFRQVKLYWYDSLIENFTTTVYSSDHSSPRVTLDDKRLYATQQGTNDILFFYHKNNNLYYRQQRDRYTIERLLLENVPGREIAYCGMSDRNRIQIQWTPPT